MIMNEVDKRFAARIRQVREELGWSAQRVADRSGVTRVALSKIENVSRGVSLGEAAALSQALGVALEDLIRPGTFTVQSAIVCEVQQ